MTIKSIGVEWRDLRGDWSVDEADESVACENMIVERGKGGHESGILKAVDENELETELADFHSFIHHIDAVEIVGEDSFKDRGARTTAA